MAPWARFARSVDRRTLASLATGSASWTGRATVIAETSFPVVRSTGPDPTETGMAATRGVSGTFPASLK